ncbi:MAG: formylglycine-generating enzyme family protein [Magnetococcales bacterium]|nr:formylglycine-generating enzyme family protein [Magnetococcales bacterium]
MRWIPPGEFMMGSPEDEHDRYPDEGPQHRVTIRAGYWLCDTACTQEMWQAVMGSNPSHFQSPDRPVEQVSFEDARAFCKQLESLLPGLGLGLPSEAQWEYACRAGITTPFSFTTTTITTEQVNFDGNHPYLPDDAKGEYRETTVPVTSLPENPWGLYEMHGNVQEWCQDTWHENYSNAPKDGSAWVDVNVDSHVLRGGSWSSLARVSRSAFRHWYDPLYRFDNIGFRCARVQQAQAGGKEQAEPVSAECVNENETLVFRI